MTIKFNGLTLASSFSASDIIAMSLAGAAGSRKVTLEQLFGDAFAAVGQLKFPATQSASGDANTLDDYEEGTFTPGIAFGGGTTGITYGTQSGIYTKIGNRVFYRLWVTLTDNGSSIGTLTITGLPFTSSGTSSSHSAQTIRADGLAAAFVASPQGYIGVSTTSVNLEKLVSGAATNLADTDTTNTSGFMVAGHYQV